MLRIYILDNQAVARNLLTTVLLNGGHEVVGDGNHSHTNIARMVKLQPQIVCIDLGELNQEGWGLLDSIRTQLPKALIFLVSANLDAEVIQTAQTHGVVGFIVKPFNAVAVLMSIRNTILRIAKKAKPAKAADGSSNEDNDTELTAVEAQETETSASKIAPAAPGEEDDSSGNETI